jgi:hypothetical protein
MEPTHHLHISTPALVFGAMFVIGLVAIVFAFVRSMRQDRLDAEERMLTLRRYDAMYAEARPARPSEAEVQHFMSHRPSAAMPNPGPVGYAAPMYAHDPMNGLVTGMLLGEALSHGHSDHTTVVHDSYVDSSPSYDSAISYSDSSSSFSDTSGGFDASW